MLKKPGKQTNSRDSSKTQTALFVQQKDKKTFSLNAKLALFLGIISFVLYSNTLKNNFAYDDECVITQNTFVAKGISAIPVILTTPYRRGYFITPNDLYRPLSLVTFAIEYQLFEKNPMPYHLFNILLYVGCVIILFLFLDKLLQRKKTVTAFLASLLFALHPIHTEVVANIKSRDELLCFFFAFLCLNTYIKYIQTGKKMQLLIGALCFMLSFLSKETVITFLAIVPLIFFFYRNDNKKRSVQIMISISYVAIICLGIRFSVLNYYHANEASKILFIDNALAKPGLALESRIATAILIMGYYLKLLFVPYPLVCDYSYNSIPYAHFNNLWVILTVVLYFSVAYLAIRRFIRNHRDPFSFGILYFLITISLFTNLFFLIGTTMGERLLFFPTVGFCFVLTILAEKLVNNATINKVALLKNKKLLGLVIPLCLVYIVITFNRNAEWSDNYTLFSSDVKKMPNNSRLYYYFAKEKIDNIYPNERDKIEKQQVINEGISNLKRSLELFPDYWQANYYVGKAYVIISNYDSAEIYIKRAIELSPSSPEPKNTLGSIYFNRKAYPEAIELFNKAIELSPNKVNSEVYHFNIGLVYMQTGGIDSAIYQFNKTLEINPSYNYANMQLGAAYFYKKNYPTAIIYFKKELELNPVNKVDAARNIALSYRAIGNSDSVRLYESLAQKYQ